MADAAPDFSSPFYVHGSIHQPPDVNYIEALAEVYYPCRLRFDNSVCRGNPFCERLGLVHMRWLVDRSAARGGTPELTRGKSKSRSHEFTGELTSKVDSPNPSRSQWLQLPTRTAR